MTTREKVVTTIKSILLSLTFLVYMLPFFMVIINAFKTKRDIVKEPLSLVGKHGMSFNNFIEAFQKMNFMTAFVNSLIITGISVLVIILVSSMCAHLFVRKDWKICRILFLLMIFSMVIPFQVVMIPLMSIYGGIFHILNNRATLIFMHTGFSVSLAVFMYHGFIRSSVPLALEEAASIDGAKPLRVFFTIVFPLMKPITATLIILQTLALWNDYLLPSLVLSKKGLYTLPLATKAFYGTHNNDLNLLLAALLLIIIPVIIIYLALQKYIIEGVVAGAVKS